MSRPIIAIAAVTGFIMLAWSFLQPRGYQWTLPENIPTPLVPTDNAMSDIKVELGRWLFHDRRLSVNSSMSCATCHRQELAFTDAQPVPTGATGELHPRGAMTLVNAGYGSRLTWANHLLDRLENQALTPLFGENPVEMGMGGREEVVVKLLRTDVRYRSLVPSVFPTDEDPYSVLNAVRAIASFVRSIVSFDSAYDRYLAGDPSAMDESAVRGMTLFFSEKTECFHCHGGFNFTDSSTHTSSRIESVGFHNNGLYNIGDNGGYPPGNTGLHDMTGKRRDMGRFKAPTLRNISLTAPYMHDGSIESLDAVLDHYQQGGRQIREGPYSGDGSRNPYKSVFVRAFELEETERADLLAFLDALTDRSVLTNPRFSNPFTPSSTQ